MSSKENLEVLSSAFACRVLKEPLIEKKKVSLSVSVSLFFPYHRWFIKLDELYFRAYPVDILVLINLSCLRRISEEICGNNIFNSRAIEFLNCLAELDGNDFLLKRLF